MRLLQACLVLALACAAMAVRVAYETPMTPPSWRFVAEVIPDLDYTQTLHFSLKQSNLDKLESALWEVSTPSSPKYGRHWSFEEVGAFTAPASAARDTVENWLVANGIPASAMTWTPYNSWLRVDVPRRVVEEILSYVRSLLRRSSV